MSSDLPLRILVFFPFFPLPSPSIVIPPPRPAPMLLADFRVSNFFRSPIGRSRLLPSSSRALPIAPLHFISLFKHPPFFSFDKLEWAVSRFGIRLTLGAQEEPIDGFSNLCVYL